MPVESKLTIQADLLLKGTGRPQCILFEEELNAP